MFLHGPSSTLPLQYSWNMTVTQGGHKLPFNTCKMYINLAEDVPVPIESKFEKNYITFILFRETCCLQNWQVLGLHLHSASREYGDFLRFFINALARLKTWTIEKTRFATKGNCINIPYTTTLQNDDCTIILAKTMFAWQSGHSTCLYKHLFSKCSGRSAFFTNMPHSGCTQGSLTNSQLLVWAYKKR